MKLFPVRFLYLAIALIFLLTGCTGLDTKEPVAAKATNALSDKDIIDGKKAPVVAQTRESAPKKQTISLAAIGDVLMHDVVYNAAKTNAGYNFNPFFSEVKPYLEKADITFANQESMIGGATLGVSTYPRFNSPFEVGDALRYAGVDVVSMANNHTLDRGKAAIQQAIQHWKKIRMVYVGANQNAEDQARMRVIKTKQGVSVAFLAYTYGTNGLTVPAGEDYLVQYIDRSQIRQAIQQAHAAADAVVLSLHFGNEYERQPNKEQEALAQFAADAGADVILGHHPHVLQPMAWIQRKDGQKTLCVYSLGNFISGQKGVYKQTGGILSWNISKTVRSGKTAITVENPSFIPTWVTYGAWKPEPMYKLQARHLSGMDQIYEETKKHMSARMSDLQFTE